MSFSSDVKSELYGHINKARHCQIAELAAIISYGCSVANEGQDTCLRLDNDNELLARKYFTLINKTISINEWDSIVNDDALQVLQLIKVLDDKPTPKVELDYINGMITQQACCKRAFIRGAFLTAGTVIDPNKAYQYEVVAKSLRQAEQLQDMLKTFEINAKIVTRKNHYVVYLKEGAQIVEVLNVMEAHLAMMEYENVRIVKDMRNSVNRKVNCETANISKMINASVKQVEDIEYIQRRMGISKLPETLGEMATVRLEHPDAPLKELGEYLSTPIGKSGVNHRLRRISEIADKLRKQEG